MNVHGFRASLRLARPFAIASGASSAEENLFARLVDDGGHEGWGEAAPTGNVTGETVEAAAKELARLEHDSALLEGLIEAAQRVPGGSSRPSVRSAVTVAFLDAAGKAQRRPLHQLLNLPEGALESSVTIGIGTPAQALEEAAEWDAAGWRIFKVKLGGPDDEAVLRSIRDRYPEKVLRVDANGAWTPATARARLPFLERMDVELLEQPLPRENVEESIALARATGIPILLDESVLDTADLVSAIRDEAAVGVNVKLAKCGGPFEARRMVKLAKDAGWKVMIGCMVESSLGAAAGAAFAGVVDYADLDANATLVNDPFEGFAIEGGRVTTPSGPGVGVKPSRHAQEMRPLGARKAASS